MARPAPLIFSFSRSIEVMSSRSLWSSYTGPKWQCCCGRSVTRSGGSQSGSQSLHRCRFRVCATRTARHWVTRLLTLAPPPRVQRKRGSWKGVVSACFGSRLLPEELRTAVLISNPARPTQFELQESLRYSTDNTTNWLHQGLFRYYTTYFRL